MNRILLPLLFLLIGFGGAGYYFYYHQDKTSPTPLTQGNVCEPDSMVCSDGTIVRREPPNCDFAPCPSETASGSAETSSEEIIITGKTICLPHRNSSGPQTMECALGLEGDDGNNYGLNDPGWKFLIGTGNGVEVEITGNLTWKSDSKYDSVGTIQIENLIKK